MLSLTATRGRFTSSALAIVEGWQMSERLDSGRAVPPHYEGGGASFRKAKGGGFRSFYSVAIQNHATGITCLSAFRAAVG